jgi:hypothetical protein
MRGVFLVSERLYEALLHLYPAHFRSVYGWQMSQTFRDACRAAHHRNGAVGLLALWLPTLLDLIKSALEERARQGEIAMSKERSTSWASPLTIIIGLLWVLASIGEFVLLVGLGSPDTFWDMFWFFPVLLSFVLMIPTFIMTRLRYHDAAGAPGRLGLILSIAGCVAMCLFVLFGNLIDVVAPALDDGKWPDYVTSACFFIIMIGHMLFGIDALRNKLLPRWNVTPLLVSVPAVLLIVPSLIIEENWPRDFHLVLITTFLRFSLTGICWVLLGIAMNDKRREPKPAAETSALSNQ